MGMIGSVLRSLTSGSIAKRRWTPAEVRELISRRKLTEASLAAEALHETIAQRALVALCLKGEVAFHEHRDADAERMFREALSRAPGLPDAHYGLALVLVEQGQEELAVLHAQFAANNGTEPRFSAQLGLCHVRRGSYALATTALTRATRLDPLDKASWSNLGIALRARRDVGGARAALRRALEIDPGFTTARSNLEALEADVAAGGKPVAQDEQAADSDSSPHLEEVRRLRATGDLMRAIEECEAIYLAHPDDGLTAIELFELYREQGDTQTGIDALRAYLSVHPDDTNVVSVLGRALVKEKEYRQGKPLVESALQQWPNDVRLLLAMADIRQEQDRFADAGVLIEKACEIEPSATNRAHLATSLVARYRYREAIELIDELLAEWPHMAEELLAMRVHALTHAGRHDEALPILDRAIAEAPREPIRRFPRATIHLLHERYAEGWDDYAMRTLSSVKHLRMLPFPMWQGHEPLEGKTILLLAEQGLGDQVMFASCLPDLLARSPTRVIVEVVDRVAPTIARSFPTCEIVATRQDNSFDWVVGLGRIDYFIAIGDLPRLFRRRHEDFPAHQGYLRADPDRVRYWREQLAARGPGPYIGVSWRGGNEATRRALRTMDVLQLAPLVQGKRAEWVCLQYGDVKDDLARTAAHGMPLHYWAESIKVLDDFAALITALDLVITVCNTTVHYAGALNRPVWIMAPRIPEWRYGLHSKVLPWYPSSRVFRQDETENWQRVLETIDDEFKAWRRKRDQAHG
ncbi:tetratricopeptide repeat protein [uncultured Methylibium sp.]|uniref:tetratricopeptide repeat protein n=1 Tax=uncultured Methylibium sp. TaxID=381093 RepID=UPI0025EE7E75|nr:tetratricopeptide repeat protein [uncultured Methylibium sp.]